MTADAETGEGDVLRDADGDAGVGEMRAAEADRGALEDDATVVSERAAMLIANAGRRSAARLMWRLLSS